MIIKRRTEKRSHTRLQLMSAALELMLDGRSFAQISLREVTRQAGVVPTAFYRHFRDMDELGLELVNQSALCLHDLIKHIRLTSGASSESKTLKNVDNFFDSVTGHPQQWAFIISERWGGSELLRGALAREIQFFQADLVAMMEALSEFKQMTPADLKILCEILINLCFSWGINALTMRALPEQEALVQRQELRTRAVRQLGLLFKGVSNWRSKAAP